MVDFIAARYPNAVNIRKNLDMGEYVVIKQCDDEVFQVLASIPDTPMYWVCDMMKFERIK